MKIFFTCYDYHHLCIDHYIQVQLTCQGDNIQVSHFGTPVAYCTIKWHYMSWNLVGLCHTVHCYDIVVSFNYSNRQWKSRAMTSHTSCRSPESARMMKDCTSAGWHELTMERLWSTKPKPGSRSILQPGHDDLCRPQRRAPQCTWRTRSRESPAHLRIAWVQTREWPPPPPLTHPPTQLNTTPAQVIPWGRVA